MTSSISRRSKKDENDEEYGLEDIDDQEQGLLESETTKQKEENTRKNNKKLGILLFFFLCYLAIPRHKRKAYIKSQQEKLGNLAEMIKEQKAKRAEKFTNLNKLIKDETDMVSKVQHEEEMEKLKINITKSESKQNEQDAHIEKLETELEEKKKFVEQLQSEVDNHKVELAKVKEDMVKDQIKFDFFCAECEFQDEEGNKAGTCGKRKEELMKEKNIAEDVATMAVIKLCPNCLNHVDGITQKQLPSLYKFCETCKYNAQGVVTTCAERKEFIKKEHNQPDDVAAKSVMNLDPSCATALKFCNDCRMVSHPFTCAARADFLARKDKVSLEDTYQYIIDSESDTCGQEIGQ